MSTVLIIDITTKIVTSVATILVVLLALFGEKIRSWLFCPRLNFYVGNEEPFIELVNVDGDSDSVNTVKDIRIRVMNCGSASAKNCRVVVDAIYTQRGGTGEYYQAKEFLPKPYFWDGNTTTQDLIPSIPSYISAARIAETGEMVSSDAPQIGPASCALYIMVKTTNGGYYKVGKGRFVFPMVLFADNITNPVKYYIEIFWNGDFVGVTNRDNFNIKIITETEFRRISGGRK